MIDESFARGSRSKTAEQVPNNADGFGIPTNLRGYNDWLTDAFAEYVEADGSLRPKLILRYTAPTKYGDESLNINIKREFEKGGRSLMMTLAMTVSCGPDENGSNRWSIPAEMAGHAIFLKGDRKVLSCIFTQDLGLKTVLYDFGDFFGGKRTMVTDSKEMTAVIKKLLDIMSSDSLANDIAVMVKGIRITKTDSKAFRAMVSEVFGKAMDTAILSESFGRGSRGKSATAVTDKVSLNPFDTTSNETLEESLYSTLPLLGFREALTGNGNIVDLSWSSDIKDYRNITPRYFYIDTHCGNLCLGFGAQYYASGDKVVDIYVDIPDVYKDSDGLWVLEDSYEKLLPVKPAVYHINDFFGRISIVTEFDWTILAGPSKAYVGLVKRTRYPFARRMSDNELSSLLMRIVSTLGETSHMSSEISALVSTDGVTAEEIREKLPSLIKDGFGFDSFDELTESFGRGTRSKDGRQAVEASVDLSVYADALRKSFAKLPIPEGTSIDVRTEVTERYGTTIVAKMRKSLTSTDKMMRLKVDYRIYPSADGKLPHAYSALWVNTDFAYGKFGGEDDSYDRWASFGVPVKGILKGEPLKTSYGENPAYVHAELMDIIAVLRRMALVFIDTEMDKRLRKLMSVKGVDDFHIRSEVKKVIKEVAEKSLFGSGNEPVNEGLSQGTDAAKALVGALRDRCSDERLLDGVEFTVDADSLDDSVVRVRLYKRVGLGKGVYKDKQLDFFSMYDIHLTDGGKFYVPTNLSVDGSIAFPNEESHDAEVDDGTEVHGFTEDITGVIDGEPYDDGHKYVYTDTDRIAETVGNMLSFYNSRGLDLAVREIMKGASNNRPSIEESIEKLRSALAKEARSVVLTEGLSESFARGSRGKKVTDVTDTVSLNPLDISDIRSFRRSSEEFLRDNGYYAVKNFSLGDIYAATVKEHGDPLFFRYAVATEVATCLQLFKYVNSGERNFVLSVKLPYVYDDTVGRFSGDFDAKASWCLMAPTVEVSFDLQDYVRASGNYRSRILTYPISANLPRTDVGKVVVPRLDFAAFVARLVRLLTDEDFTEDLRKVLADNGSVEDIHAIVDRFFLALQDGGDDNGGGLTESFGRGSRSKKATDVTDSADLNPLDASSADRLATTFREYLASMGFRHRNDGGVLNYGNTTSLDSYDEDIAECYSRVDLHNRDFLVIEMGGQYFDEWGSRYIDISTGSVNFRKVDGGWSIMIPKLSSESPADGGMLESSFSVYIAALRFNGTLLQPICDSRVIWQSSVDVPLRSKYTQTDFYSIPFLTDSEMKRLLLTLAQTFSPHSAFADAVRTQLHTEEDGLHDRLKDIVMRNMTFEGIADDTLDESFGRGTRGKKATDVTDAARLNPLDTSSDESLKGSLTALAEDLGFEEFNPRRCITLVRSNYKSFYHGIAPRYFSIKEMGRRDGGNFRLEMRFGAQYYASGTNIVRVDVERFVVYKDDKGWVFASTQRDLLNIAAMVFQIDNETDRIERKAQTYCVMDLGPKPKDPNLVSRNIFTLPRRVSDTELSSLLMRILTLFGGSSRMSSELSSLVADDGNTPSEIEAAIRKELSSLIKDDTGFFVGLTESFARGTRGKKATDVAGTVNLNPLDTTSLKSFSESLSAFAEDLGFGEYSNQHVINTDGWSNLLADYSPLSPRHFRIGKFGDGSEMRIGMQKYNGDVVVDIHTKPFGLLRRDSVWMVADFYDPQRSDAVTVSIQIYDVNAAGRLRIISRADVRVAIPCADNGMGRSVHGVARLGGRELSSMMVSLLTAFAEDSPLSKEVGRLMSRPGITDKELDRGILAAVRENVILRADGGDDLTESFGRGSRGKKATDVTASTAFKPELDMTDELTLARSCNEMLPRMGFNDSEHYKTANGMTTNLKYEISDETYDGCTKLTFSRTVSDENDSRAILARSVLKFYRGNFGWKLLFPIKGEKSIHIRLAVAPHGAGDGITNHYVALPQAPTVAQGIGAGTFCVDIEDEELQALIVSTARFYADNAFADSLSVVLDEMRDVDGAAFAQEFHDRTGAMLAGLLVPVNNGGDGLTESFGRGSRGKKATDATDAARLNPLDTSSDERLKESLTTLAEDLGFEEFDPRSRITLVHGDVAPRYFSIREMGRRDEGDFRLELQFGAQYYASGTNLVKVHVNKFEVYKDDKGWVFVEPRRSVLSISLTVFRIYGTEIERKEFTHCVMDLGPIIAEDPDLKRRISASELSSLLIRILSLFGESSRTSSELSALVSDDGNTPSEIKSAIREELPSLMRDDTGFFVYFRP